MRMSIGFHQSKQRWGKVAIHWDLMERNSCGRDACEKAGNLNSFPKLDDAIAECKKRNLDWHLCKICDKTAELHLKPKK